MNADGAAPVLVVGGTGDPNTPYPGARHMARALGDGVGVLLTAEEEGHGTYPQNRCVTETVDQYLRTGRTPAPGDGVPGQHVLRPVRVRRAAVSTPVRSQGPWACTTTPPGPRPALGGCRRGRRGRVAERCAGGPREDIEPYTIEEVQRLLVEAAKLRNSARWVVALALGLRQGEALGLHWEDVDLDAGYARIRKNRLRPKYAHGCGTQSVWP